MFAMELPSIFHVPTTKFASVIEKFKSDHNLTAPAAGGLKSTTRPLPKSGVASPLFNLALHVRTRCVMARNVKCALTEYQISRTS
jgi:hypothetical protein